MRILFDSKAFERPGGGIYEYAVQLVRGLHAIGEVELFAQIEAAKLPETLKGMVTPLGNFRFRGWRGWGLEGIHAEWLCRKHKIDIYHSLYYIPKPRTRIPFVAFCHDFTWERYPEQFPNSKNGIDYLKKKSLQNADRVLCNSNSTANDCLTFLNRKQGVLVTNLGYDEKFRCISTDNGVSVQEKFKLKRPYWVFTGARYGYKNFDRLLKAFEFTNLAESYDLVCIGYHDYVSHNEKEGWAKDRESQPSYLRLLGYVSDQERIRILQSAFALAYPSEFEGFGIPVIEALASGVPVLCSNTSSLPEVGGDAAVYVDPHDVEDIRRGLSEVSAWTPEEREPIVKQGRVQATQFSWKRCAEETYSVYEHLLSKP